MTVPDDATVPVEVAVSRYEGARAGEITITVTIPRTADEPKRRIYVTLTPANFALALTGRGAIVGEMTATTFKGLTSRPKPKES